MQMHPHGQLHLRAGMPARAVEHQQDVLVLPRAHGLGKLGQGERERSHRHGRQQEPPRAARGWMHEGVQITPLIAMLDHRLGALPARTPHAAHDRLEPDAVLIGRPQLYPRVRVGLLEGLDNCREVFLKASCAAGAAFAWRGRGTLEVHPRRRSVSQPRCGCTRRPS